MCRPTCIHYMQTYTMCAGIHIYRHALYIQNTLCVQAYSMCMGLHYVYICTHTDARVSLYESSGAHATLLADMMHPASSI